MKVKPRLAFLIIVLFQILILVGLMGFNEANLAFGKSVVLQTAPVDPRDIFRGDYVVLRYEISTLSNIPGWLTFGKQPRYRGCTKRIGLSLFLAR